MPRQTHQDIERNQAHDELDEFMEGLGDGTLHVKCTRLDPPLGYCGDFFVTKQNPLTLKEIKRRFGGRVFQLNSRSSNGQIKKQKTITIDDVPRREGLEILPDGTNARPDEKPESKKQEDADPLSVIMGAGLPPNVMRQVIPYLVGLGGAIPPEQPKPQTNNFELMQQQAIMDMMSAQMRQNMEFQREMQRFKRESYESEKPKNPYSDMEMIFKMMREIQGFKSELGGDGNLATEALQGTMSLVESGLTEYLALKKLQAQSEIAKGKMMQESATPLPPRQNTPQLSQPQVIKEGKDPVQIAREMGQMFRNLDGSQQQAVLDAFLNESPENSDNIENIGPNDTIEYEGEFLDATDQEILNGETNPNKDAPDHLSDGEHTPPADDDDQINRQGDTGRIEVPTH
jgi:hypothetical protein